MTVEITEAHPELSLPIVYKKNYQCEVIIKGKIPPYGIDSEVDENFLAWSIAFELINNCVENRVPGSEIGAKQIQVTFEHGKIVVEDDFIYENPEEVLASIITIRDSGKPQTTRPIEEDLGFPLGGVGIFTTVKSLKDYGGELNYFIKDGTIVAIATWKPD